MKNIVQWMLAAILICGSAIFTSCTTENDDNPVPPEQPEYSGVPLVILDTDIGSSTDDLFALQMLYRYVDRERCKLLGVVLDRQGEDYAILADVMNTYYGHGDVPMGLERRGVSSPNVFIDYKNLYKHANGKGKPFPRSFPNCCPFVNRTTNGQQTDIKRTSIEQEQALNLG